jgi:hypothetical protein
MVPHVPERLSRLLRDLPKGIAVKEVELQRLPLFRGDLLAKPIETSFGNQGIHEQSPLAGAEMLFLKFVRIVMLAHGQELAAVDSPMVGDLNNPRGSRSLACVKERRFLKQEEEDLLHEVIGFPFVAEDAIGDIPDGAVMLAEQQGQSISGAFADLFHELVIRSVRCLINDSGGDI